VVESRVGVSLGYDYWLYKDQEILLDITEYIPLIVSKD
jgi:hypothetical protein